MAGVPAGRLSIEIVAEIARLQKDLDAAKRAVKAASADISASARSANDNLEQIGQAAADAANGISQFGRSVSGVSGSAGSFQAGVARSTQDLNEMGSASALSSNELVNLGFQLNDFAVQVASGGNPFVALVQQGSQVAGVLAQSGLGVKGFARELAIATGIIKVSGDAGLAAAAQAAAANQAAIASALQRAEADVVAARAEEALARAAIANATTAAESASAQLALARATNAASTASARAAAASTALANANAASAAASQASAASQVTSLGRLGRAGLVAAGALAVVAGGVALLTKEVNDNAKVNVSWQNVLLGAYDAVSRALSERVSQAFKDMGVDVGEVWDSVVGFTRSAVNFIIGAVVAVPKVIADTYSLIGPAIGDAFFSGVNLAAAAFDALTKAAADGLNQIVGFFNDTFGTSLERVTVGSVGRIANPFAGAMGRLGSAGAKSLTESFSRDYIGEFSAFIMPDAIKRQLAENAKKAGKDAGGAFGRGMAESIRDELPKAFTDAVADSLALASRNVDAIADEYGRKIAAGNALAREQDELRDSYAELIREMERELALLGKTGPEREALTLEFEKQDFFARNAALGVDELNKKWAEYLALRKQITDASDFYASEEAAIQRLVGSFGDLANMIGGRAGRGLDALLNLEVRLKDGEAQRFGEVLARQLNKTFNGLADKLSGAISGALAGAQIGSGVNSLLGSLGVKSSNTGAQLGGAIGGAFFGPLGAIGGSILGGLVGGMLKSAPRASATVSVIGGEAMQTAIQGNRAQLRQVATGLANSLIGGLSQIAEQLGGQLADFGSISIGTRNGTFRVDPTGRGRTKNLPQFATEQEAIAEALRIAIQRGAIAGLRAGTETLLRASGELEANLSKALAFEGVFTRLARATDPLKFELDALDKEFAQLRQIFAEARASTEELAALEQLYGIEREEIMNRFATAVDEAGNVITENIDLIRERTQLEARLLELQGDAAGALALMRQLELEALDASLRPLMQQIYALEDQAVAAEEARAAAEALAEAERRVADERRGLEDRLLALLGDTAEIRRRELEALDPSNRAILERIFALEDAREAEQAAAQAMAEVAAAQARVMQEREGLETRLLQLIGNTAALRERELAALDPANRAILEQIFALEDQAAAAEIASRAAQELADAQEQAAREAAEVQARIASEREGLETRLLQFLGDTTALRERELAALDPSNRALLSRLFALEDERAASEAAAQAAQELADAQARAAEEALAAQERAAAEALALQERIASERFGLEGRLLELLGDTAALRQRELDALAPANRAILERIFAIQDERAATEAAAQAASALADAERRAAEERAARERRIADERFRLEGRLLELQGNTAALRERELAALDPSNRALQEQIYALEDAAGSLGVFSGALSELSGRNALFGGFVLTAREFLTELDQLSLGTGNNFVPRLVADIRNLRGEIVTGAETLIEAVGGTVGGFTKASLVLQPLENVIGLAAQGLEKIEDVIGGIAESVRTGAGDLRAAADDYAAAVTSLTALSANIINARDTLVTAAAIRFGPGDDFANEVGQINPALGVVAQAAQDVAKALTSEVQRTVDEQLPGAFSGLIRNSLALSSAFGQLGQNDFKGFERFFAVLSDELLGGRISEADFRSLLGFGVTMTNTGRFDGQDSGAILSERAGLERRLLELQADTAALRALELAELDESNRALLQRIFAIEDEQAATEAASRAAEAEAERQRAIGEQRAGLERQILELLGDTAALRELELAALDPSNRALQLRIYAIEDERAAAEAAARAAEELAAAERAIAEERQGLLIRLLEAQGDATGALALRRAQELAGIDESNRGLLRQIYALEDAAAAQAAYEEALSRTQGALRDAVEAERSAINDRLSPLRSELERLVDAVTPDAVDLTAALEVRDLLSEGLDLAARLAGASRDVLGENEQIVAMQRDAARRELFRMAETRRIDAENIDRLIAQATDFGDGFANPVALLREQARTANVLAELARVQEGQARAAQAVEEARASEARSQVLAQINALRAQIAIEEASLASLDALLDRFGLLNDSVLSVADAVRDLEAVMADEGAPMPAGPVAMPLTGGAPANSATAEEVAALRAEQEKTNEYLRELVRVNLKQERDLKELVIQGETTEVLAL